MSQSDAERPLLNGPQRRHFEVLLAMLQDTLAKVERLASDSAPHFGGATAHPDDLPADFAATIRPAVADLRRLITRFSSELGLRQRAVSRARSVRALVIAEMVRIEDSTADKLHGYGAVDPRVATTIDPLLRELHALLASILARVDGAPTKRHER